MESASSSLTGNQRYKFAMTFKHFYWSGFLWIQFAALTAFLGFAHDLQAKTIDFASDVQPLLTKYCVGCHNTQEAEGGFACEDFAGLIKGSKQQVVVKAGSAKLSPILKLLTANDDLRMPPKDEAQPTDAEIAIIRDWIDQGALNSTQVVSLRDRLKVASVAATHHLDPAITALYLIDGDHLAALGRYNEVELFNLSTGKTVERWSEVVGKVTSIRPSQDGKKIVIASGVTGVGGQISVLDLTSRKIVQQNEGHRDTIYSAVISPDGTLVASAGYDRRIIIWDAASGKELRHLDGHNGPIYDLDFHPSGKLIASCSGDETTKIWDVVKGVRLDTLSQGEAEQYCVRFSRDGNRVLAAGADRRVRVWKLISRDREAINPMLHACFAHEKSILALRLSPDGKILATASEDHTVKLWSSDNLAPIGEVGRLNDVPTDAAWKSNGREIAVATVSGRIESFSIDKVLNEYAVSQSHQTEMHKQSHDSVQSMNETLTALMLANSKMESTSEIEPNNNADQAMSLKLPTEVLGRVFSESSSTVDEDWFAFDAKVGEPWTITASAASMDSPIDCAIEIRDSESQPVLRTRLQAVRESFFTFRGKDSSISDDFRMHRWEDMELNELLYSGGEVVKLWLYPRGPDSGFKVYPGSGKRRTYFDTTASSHALGEPAWIVRELSPDESPVPNGLPTFPIYFENDDDASRRTGKNSRLIFTALKDGRYLARLRDARRLQGEAFEYKMSIRKQMIDYKVSTETKDLSIVAGTGAEFSVKVDRIDDFEGSVELKIEGLPEGFVVSEPLTIERGQEMAFGSIFLPKDLEDIPKDISITIHANAQIYGQTVERRVEKSIPIKIGKAPVVVTHFVKANDEKSDEVTELKIRPGETISTFIVVDRGKEIGDIGFGKEDCGRNLPHGIFVSNIGLSGLVVKPGENTREVFITAAPWVESQTRLFHLKSTMKGTPTTKPILVRVEATSTH